MMKKYLFILLLSAGFAAKAQKVDSMFVNLYTDSLKLGTYNYINVDGHLTNGRYLPLDSTHLIFTSSAGSFSGNNLWLDPGFTGDKVHINVCLRDNRKMFYDFTVYVKKGIDPPLKSEKELYEEMKAA